MKYTLDLESLIILFQTIKNLFQFTSAVRDSFGHLTVRPFHFRISDQLRTFRSIRLVRRFAVVDSFPSFRLRGLKIVNRGRSEASKFSRGSRSLPEVILRL